MLRGCLGSCISIFILLIIMGGIGIFLITFILSILTGWYIQNFNDLFLYNTINYSGEYFSPLWYIVDNYIILERGISIWTL